MRHSQLQRLSRIVSGAWRSWTLTAVVAAVVIPSVYGISARAAAGQGKASSGPQLNFHEASGCGALVLYTWNEARTEVLILRIDQSRVTIKNGSTDLEIGPAGSPVTAELEVSDNPFESFPYCEEGNKTSENRGFWPVLSGKVKVIVKRSPGRPFTPVNVGIDRLVVQVPNGQQIKQRRDIQFTAAVAELR